MKKIISFRRTAGAVLLGIVLNAPPVYAADAPQNPPPASPRPTSPAPPPPADTTGRARVPGGANIPARGNFPGGLNLDDKQRDLLREATRKEGDELRQLNDKLQAAQKDLVQATVAEKYDEQVVREKAEVIAKLQTEITVLRSRAFATIVPTLKPEQREQLDNPQMANAIIMSGGGFGGGRGGIAGPGGGFRNAPEGQQPPERVRRRDGGNEGADQPRRRGTEPAP